MHFPNEPDDLGSRSFKAMTSLMDAAGLEPTSLDLLLAAAPDRQTLLTLLRWMALHPGDTAVAPGMQSDSPFRQMAAEIDESAFSLTAWVESLLFTHQWLEERGLHANFTDALSYIGCCATAASHGAATTPLADLRSTVEEMLNRYGLEAATPVA